MMPLNITLIMIWEFSPHFTDESLRLESYFNSLSLYPRQATLPCLPQPTPCVCARAQVCASKQNFPCCHGNPPREACPTSHPWHRAGGLAPPPRIARDGVYPTQGEQWSHRGKNRLPHSNMQSTSSRTNNAPGTQPGPRIGEISCDPALWEHPPAHES